MIYALGHKVLAQSVPSRILVSGRPLSGLEMA